MSECFELPDVWGSPLPAGNTMTTYTARRLYSGRTGLTGYEPGTTGGEQQIYHQGKKHKYFFSLLKIELFSVGMWGPDSLGQEKASR